MFHVLSQYSGGDKVDLSNNPKLVYTSRALCGYFGRAHALRSVMRGGKEAGWSGGEIHSTLQNQVCGRFAFTADLDTIDGKSQSNTA